jgi:hypothetical protein
MARSNTTSNGLPKLEGVVAVLASWLQVWPLSTDLNTPSPKYPGTRLLMERLPLPTYSPVP